MTPNFKVESINGKSRMVPLHSGTNSRGTEVGSEGFYTCCECHMLLPASSFRTSSLRRWVNNAWQWARPGQASRHPHVGCLGVLPLDEMPKAESLIKTPKPIMGMVTAYLDIETSGISKSEYTKVLSYALLDAETRQVWSQQITKEDIDGDTDINDRLIRADTRILTLLVRDLARYNRIVTWYGKGFDVPTLRTRCSLLGVEFPSPWDIIHEDLYYTSRNKYRFTSNRLGSVAAAYGCPETKTNISPKAWDMASRGNEEALEYVKTHNIIDVKLLAFIDAKFKGQHVLNRSKL